MSKKHLFRMFALALSWATATHPMAQDNLAATAQDVNDLYTTTAGVPMLQLSNGVLLKDPTILNIAEAHGKSAAQVLIRWHIQEGFSVIPGATNPDYIKENIQVFSFQLTDAEAVGIVSHLAALEHFASIAASQLSTTTA